MCTEGSEVQASPRFASSGRDRLKASSYVQQVDAAHSRLQAAVGRSSSAVQVDRPTESSAPAFSWYHHTR